MERTTTEYEYKGHTVTITSDGIWFTVYREGNTIGTIERSHMGQPSWAGYLPTGAKVTKARCIGPRTALMAIVNA